MHNLESQYENGSVFPLSLDIGDIVDYRTMGDMLNFSFC